MGTLILRMMSSASLLGKRNWFYYELRVVNVLMQSWTGEWRRWQPEVKFSSADRDRREGMGVVRGGFALSSHSNSCDTLCSDWLDTDLRGLAVVPVIVISVSGCWFPATWTAQCREEQGHTTTVSIPGEVWVKACHRYIQVHVCMQVSERLS